MLLFYFLCDAFDGGSLSEINCVDPDNPDEYEEEISGSPQRNDCLREERKAKPIPHFNSNIDRSNAVLIGV